MSDIKLVRNDTRPVFGGKVGYDLDGYSVNFHFGFDPVLILPAVVLTHSPSESTFEGRFSPGDLDVATGTYEYEIEFDDNLGGVLTYKYDSLGKKLRVKVEDEIA